MIKEWPEHRELLRLTADLLWLGPRESEEHFQARCLAFCAVRQRMRREGFDIPPEGDWERDVARGIFS